MKLNLTNCAPQKKLFENAYGTAFRDNETHMMPLPQNTVAAGLESRRRNSTTSCKLWQILVYLKDHLHLNHCISVIQQHRILMKTCPLHCSVKNADNSFHFFMQNIHDYLITFSLKCVFTLTQSAFLPSHQIQTSVFKFLLSFIQLPENNKQLLDEVEHDIMNYQSRGMSLALADITQNPNSIIVLLYII